MKRTAILSSEIVAVLPRRPKLCVRDIFADLPILIAAVRTPTTGLASNKNQIWKSELSETWVKLNSKFSQNPDFLFLLGKATEHFVCCPVVLF